MNSMVLDSFQNLIYDLATTISECMKRMFSRPLSETLRALQIQCNSIWALQHSGYFPIHYESAN